MSIWGWWERSQVSEYNSSMCSRRMEEESLVKWTGGARKKSRLEIPRLLIASL
jgi:hypothetical protein